MNTEHVDVFHQHDDGSGTTAGVVEPCSEVIPSLEPVALRYLPGMVWPSRLIRKGHAYATGVTAHCSGVHADAIPSLGNWLQAHLKRQQLLRSGLKSDELPKERLRNQE